MEKFLLLIREDLKKVDQMSEEEFSNCIIETTNWVNELASSGNFIQGDPLLTTGKWVNKNHILSDGPFIEAKEAISGFMIIQAENLEQAAALCQTFPQVLDGTVVIEVRPIMEIRNE